MKSRLASVRAGGGLDRVDCAVQLLEDEWERHGEVELEKFWARERGRDPDLAIDWVALLSELVKADMRRRFARGETPTVTAYLETFPELRAVDDRVLSLVYEEFCLNEECGAAPDVESFCNRYPDWKSSLASQLQCHRLISQAAGVRRSLPRFPEPGQDFEEFRLQSLLGSGGMSRVFLANDLSLGGKQVVLKVTLDRGQEPKVQGPLDHPHIVPVNSVAYQADGQLCGLSMPYRPGLTLDELIPLVDPASRPRRAIALWESLVRGTRGLARPSALADAEPSTDGNGLLAGPRGDGWEGFPVRGSYAQGVAWIVMILARALHYAHRRQTFHRDVKPGNLLLTLQSGPQLLDFNLAESPHSANQAQTALHGGTLPYMAPEQIEAFINPELWGKVGARADVYSLGLVFRELLTGQKPDLPAAGMPPARAFRAVLDRRLFLDTAVRRFNTAIPHALEAIVGKCLALAPDDRYQDAQSLEHDLDRFLNHLPLEQSVNPSRRERMGNWTIRNRKVLSGTAGTIACVALMVGLWRLQPVTPPKLPDHPKIESSSAFIEALANIKHGKFDAAIALLSALEKNDLESCLVKFYLSLALDRDARTNYEADRYLRRALAISDAEVTLSGWSHDHPEVTQYLVDFADSRIKRVDLHAQAIDNGRIRDEVRDQEYREPAYEIARDALRLAETIDPASPRIQRLLARAEKIFGEYESAYTRVSNLISPADSSARLNGDALFLCWQLRIRIAFFWAERDLDEGGGVNDETRKRLRQARLDLDCCDSYLREMRFSVPDEQLLNEYHAHRDRVRTTITTAAVELKLARIDDAARSIYKAEGALAELVDFIRTRNLNDRVPQTLQLTQRIKALKNELSMAVHVPGDRKAGNDEVRQGQHADQDAAAEK